MTTTRTTAHANCDHAKTPKARAACRKNTVKVTPITATTAETIALLAAVADIPAVKRAEDWKIGDTFVFMNLTGYRPHQERPMKCRTNGCQCPESACSGKTTQSVEVLVDVIKWVDGGVEVRGASGSRATLRPGRLD